MTAIMSPIEARNRAGSVWMVLAMLAFALEDTLIKASASSLPLGQILILFGLGGTVLFGALAAANRENLFSRRVMNRTMRVRFGFEVTGRLFYGIAIALTPLSAATVILQATPLVVVAGATLVFSERVGWRRWSAIVVGLIGVLVILQPGGDSFSPLSLFAVVGMLGFAGRDLASRAAPAGMGTATLGFYGFLAVIVAGVIFAIWQGKAFVWPAAMTALYLAGAMLAGVGAYFALMKAMRTGEVSAVTPFRYTRLLFGIGFGILFFNESLTVPMIAGSLLILISGLFTLSRSKKPPSSGAT
ncbi:DMT family transporter [Paracoccus sp. Z330]|uniref:DMT family transporter n=1 Tax=Paracoccus onchidii TaxID=3017813 RepID=A0ABT4ZBT7_9RHOB|nr:DMT family transporter [Paracoccus onchidii]MDB6176720.1 DMT family transporter [Paracoccus onchidii]